MEKKKKFHRVAETSLTSYIKCRKEGLIKSQAHFILLLLDSKGSLSSRQIMKMAGIERTSVTKALRILEDQNLISHTIGVCDFTKREVRFYHLKEAEIV